ncbi:MAG: nucleoside deaminase [Desulfobacterales bacterium]|jgi:tRNA(adenine34) deaminase|nr:nucleoside deaminase [Desulfobacterales bacterium]
MDVDHRYMDEALAEAAKALAQGEFPVGCVMVYRDRVLARGSRTGSAAGGRNELDHAEMLALRQLWQSNAAFQAAGITMYCTLEPCLMCFGAILLAGIGKLVYAYEDVMGGGAGCDRAQLKPLYRESAIVVRAGIRRSESLALFKNFFSHPRMDYWRGSLLAEYTLGQ